MLNTRYKSFTVIEVIVVFALVGIIALFAFPFQMSDPANNRLNSEAQLLVSNLSQLQQNAYSRKDDSAYGIVFDADGYTIFKGNSFDTSINTERINLPNGITINIIEFTAGNEVVFTPGKLKPSGFGQLTISNSNLSYEIVVNEEGAIYEQKI